MLFTEQVFMLHGHFEYGASVMLKVGKPNQRNYGYAIHSTTAELRYANSDPVGGEDIQADC